MSNRDINFTASKPCLSPFVVECTNTAAFEMLNFLSPNSDLSQISKSSIKGLLVREVIRIVNMITQV